MKKKSLAAKKTIHSSLLYYLKNSRVKKIFVSFENYLEKFTNKKTKIGVAISGGPDSLALAYLAKCHSIIKKKKIQFFLVDHGLRKNSSKEAISVRLFLRKFDIKCKILKWKGKKPISNLQSLARKKRYELIYKECLKSNIGTVCTGHHQEDMYETFFSRLLRGSGTEGLSSFSQIEKNFYYKNKKIKLIRPLLNLIKKDLIYISNRVFSTYIKDPSNEMEKFQRARIRKLIFHLVNEGLDFKKLNLTINNLASSNKSINTIVDYNINKNVIFVQKKYLINSEFFLMPEEVILRSLSILLKNISKKNYPPRGKKLIHLIRDIKKNQYIKATLGGTIIEKIRNSVTVLKEKTKKH